MSSDAFLMIVGAILTIIVTIVSGYVIPYIKQKITAEDMETLMYYLDLAVRSADQIFKIEDYQEKKAYVKEYIIKVVDEKLHIKLTDADLETLIEGVVRQIHYGDGK